MEFRELTANEIDVRVGQVYEERGVTLLLYKNARVDMDILDETVGPMNWQRHHSRDNRNCVVSIWDIEKGEWVEKEDVGSESNTEKEKGVASDSFKRACVNWGIGRSLYSAPFIWINWKDVKTDKNNKIKDKWTVRYIEYDNKTISCLVIENKAGEVVFSYGTPKA